jgi:hypothetical protein
MLAIEFREVDNSFSLAVFEDEETEDWGCAGSLEYAFLL